MNIFDLIYIYSIKKLLNNKEGVISGHFFFLGLLDLNFELRNRLNKSPGNNIVNPVLILVVFARNPMMGGPTKNPINAIKERNAT